MKVLIITDVLNDGDELKASEDLIRQIEGAEVAASFSMFEISNGKGRLKLLYKHVSFI